MITDKQPLERIWACLNAILCDAGAAQESCSDLVFDIPHALGYLTPLSGQKTFLSILRTSRKPLKT